jgi:hypothetical protein
MGQYQLAFQIGLMAASMAYSAISAANQPAIDGPRVGDLKISTSTYGNPIPKGWGVSRLAGNMIWSSGIKESSSVHGGKGMSAGPAQRTYVYKASFAMAFAAGPAKRILRIWADNILVYDETSSGSALGVSGITFRQYYGTEDQLPDILIQADKGDLAPAHRGLVYVVAENVPLTAFGNRIPSINAEIAFDGTEHTYVTNLSETAVEPIPTGRGGSATVDWKRNQAYRKIEGTDQGIEVVNLTSMTATRYASWAQMFAGTEFAAKVVGKTPNIQNLACPSGGDIYFTTPWAGDQSMLIRVNATSLKVTGMFGGLGGSLQSHTYGVFYPYRMVAGWGVYSSMTMSTPTSRPILVSMAGYFGPQFFDGLNMTYLYGAQTLAYPTDTLPGIDGSGNGQPMTDYVHPTYENNANHDVIPGLTDQDGITDFWYFNSTTTGPTVEIRQIRITPECGWIDPSKTTRYMPGGSTNSALVLNNHVMTLHASDYGWTQIAHTHVEYDAANSALIVMITGNPGQRPIVMSLQASNTMSVTWQFVLPAGMNDFNGALSLSRLEGSTFAWGTDTFNAAIIDTRTGEILFHGGATDGHYIDMRRFWSCAAYWDSRTGAMYQETVSGFQRILLNRGAAGTSTLGDIVASTCKECGLDDTDIDVSELTDQVRGFTHTQQVGRDIVSQLTTLFQFDPIESDGRLAFRKRGRSISLTIPYEDIIKTQANAPVLSITRVEGDTIPRRAWLRYPDIDNSQQQGAQFFARTQNPENIRVTNSVAETVVDTTVVMTASEAKTACKRALLQAWQERDTIEEFGLPTKYIGLEPSDVVTLKDRNGNSLRVRLSQVNIGADLSLRVKGTIEDASLCSVTATGDNGGGWLTPVISTSYTPVPLLTDLPLLNDIDDTGGSALRVYYAAGANLGETYGGSALYASADNASWTTLAGTTVGMTWGVITNTLGDHPPIWTLDNTNTITVVIANGNDAITTCTDSQLLEGANMALVLTAAGDVEVIQFQTVTSLGGGVYQLSKLVRGKRGTDHVVGMHGSSETFILYDATAFDKATVPLGWNGLSRYERVLGRYDSFDALTSVSHMFSGRAELPYSPVGITGTRDGSNNLTISWIRRSRIGGDYWSDSYETIPLGEVSEGYSVDVLNGGSVVRTISAISPTATYSAANQIADFGSVQSSVSVVVYQISNSVGRGTGRAALI